MQSPQQGYLMCHNNEWSFIPGRNKTRPPIQLPNFAELAYSMVNNKKLFNGWKSKNHVLTARFSLITSNVLSKLIINGKVGAKQLSTMETPTLLQHHKLNQTDKNIWDAAYLAEYRGLQNIDTWEVIDESQYQQIKHLCKGILPTIAITTIKTNKDGNPERAKYRICALGNLDPHSWSKQDCYAPVLLQFELRFIIALAVQKQCIPKTGDISQAFCQAYLPLTETYVLRPPAGCPISKPNTYWKLKKTLYGLKRSPRHFYQLARKLLLEVGLHQHPSSPCLFFGTILPGYPPLYLGLYVDDLIYFSEDPAVEKHFETEFGNKIDTSFNGPIDYFLGISFSHQRHINNDVTIHMSQHAFIDSLLVMTKLEHSDSHSAPTPYRSGYPVDCIPTTSPSDSNPATKHFMQRLIGSLNWLSVSTRPDITTITSMIAKYLANPNGQHINAAKRVIKYLKGTRDYGITFSSVANTNIEAYIKFRLNQPITALSDANWGPQDASKPKPSTTEQLELFKTRSVSGFVLWLNGPLHWASKQQTVTARSTAEAEVYATDECVKSVAYLKKIVEGFGLLSQLMPTKTTIYNDNSACICWTKNMTTKGLRHIQIRENGVREMVQRGEIDVKHIEGKINIADLFTKEDKDVEHFLSVRDLLVQSRAVALNTKSTATNFGVTQSGLGGIRI